MKFRTTLEESRVGVMGIEVPAEIVDALSAGKKPAVSVSLNGYLYRSTIAVMDGKYMIPLSKDNRSAAGVEAGQTLEVELLLDTAPREVVLPRDLAAALSPAARTYFDGLSFTYRKEHVRSIEEAKTAETRQRRIDKVVALMLAGKKQ